MRKRISMLLTALMLALTMALGGAASAFADTNNLCDRHPNHKQCTVEGRGNSENTPAVNHNPNITHERDNPSDRN
jgi:uncharacterized protein YggE